MKSLSSMNQPASGNKKKTSSETIFFYHALKTVCICHILLISPHIENAIRISILSNESFRRRYYRGQQYRVILWNRLTIRFSLRLLKDHDFFVYLGRLWNLFLVNLWVSRFNISTNIENKMLKIRVGHVSVALYSMYIVLYTYQGRS